VHFLNVRLTGSREALKLESQALLKSAQLKNRRLDEALASAEKKKEEVVSHLTSPSTLQLAPSAIYTPPKIDMEPQWTVIQLALASSSSGPVFESTPPSYAESNPPNDHLKTNEPNYETNSASKPDSESDSLHDTSRKNKPTPESNPDASSSSKNEELEGKEIGRRKSSSFGKEKLGHSSRPNPEGLHKCELGCGASSPLSQRDRHMLMHFQVQAQYAFQSTNSSMLSFEQEDIISNIQLPPADWWAKVKAEPSGEWLFGELNNQWGGFPTTRVQGLIGLKGESSPLESGRRGGPSHKNVFGRFSSWVGRKEEPILTKGEADWWFTDAAFVATELGKCWIAAKGIPKKDDDEMKM
jgi:hypothetical protein